MERLGKVHEWNDGRGFGFILPLEGGTESGRTFFHVRDYRQDGRRPEPGELVKYVAGKQADGRWRATSVKRAATARVKPRPPRQSPISGFRIPRWLQLSFILAYGLALAKWIQLGKLPLEAGFVVALLCVATFIAYALDKHAAQGNAWRIPEANLHLLELAGGWPGALLAQQLLRHKTSKRSYRAVFWVMVALHCGILACWAHRDILLS